MNPKRYQKVASIAGLVVLSVLLTGCPKKSPPATGAGAAPGAGGSLGVSSTGSLTGSGLATTGATSTTGSGPGMLGSTAPGSAMASGTAIPALPSPKEFSETAALRDLQFDFDQYTIRPQETATLDANARWLRANAGALLLIEGHADERGTNEYNLVLGERRAKVTRDRLVSLGIDGTRITMITYGEERPNCTERAEPCWAKNRRAHFLVKP